MMIALRSDTPTRHGANVEIAIGQVFGDYPRGDARRAESAESLREIDTHQAKFTHLADERTVEQA